MPACRFVLPTIKSYHFFLGFKCKWSRANLNFITVDNFKKFTQTHEKQLSPKEQITGPSRRVAIQVIGMPDYFPMVTYLRIRFHVVFGTSPKLSHPKLFLFCISSWNRERNAYRDCSKTHPTYFYTHLRGWGTAGVRGSGRRENKRRSPDSQAGVLPPKKHKLH